MPESDLDTPMGNWWQPEAAGPATLAQVMEQVEQQSASGDVSRLQLLATGSYPLDDVLNGGLRPGELLVIGGPLGVGKTIWGWQAARNAVDMEFPLDGHTCPLCPPAASCASAWWTRRWSWHRLVVTLQPFLA